jgi:hypothetical protein
MDMINKRMDEEIHGNQGTCDALSFSLESYSVDIRELMEMGFDYELALTAAKKYPGNLALAINALMDHPDRIRVFSLIEQLDVILFLVDFFSFLLYC